MEHKNAERSREVRGSVSVQMLASLDSDVKPLALSPSPPYVKPEGWKKERDVVPVLWSVLIWAMG